MNTTRFYWRKAVRYVFNYQLVDSHPLRLTALEPDDGKPTFVRFRGQFEVVYADEYHLVSQQSGHLQTEVGQITTRQLFPRLLRRQRRQQGCQIPIMEVQPGQSGTSEPLSSVSSPQNMRCAMLANACYNSLTQATDTSNIRLVFAAVKETILNNALKDSGIL